MNRQVEQLGPVTILTILESHLDAGNAGQFKQVIASLQDSSPQLVLDLSQVRVLDSPGCGAILTAIRWMDRVGGHIKVCGLSTAIRETFQLFQMLRILDVYETRDQAVHTFV
jgi:anti-anti-sigma factor